MISTPPANDRSRDARGSGAAVCCGGAWRGGRRAMWSEGGAFCRHRPRVSAADLCAQLAARAAAAGLRGRVRDAVSDAVPVAQAAAHLSSERGRRAEVPAHVAAARGARALRAAGRRGARALRRRRARARAARGPDALQQVLPEPADDARVPARRRAGRVAVAVFFVIGRRVQRVRGAGRGGPLPDVQLGAQAERAGEGGGEEARRNAARGLRGISCVW